METAAEQLRHRHDATLFSGERITGQLQPVSELFRNSEIPGEKNVSNSTASQGDRAEAGRASLAWMLEYDLLRNAS
ncbi:MAG: hypothetical protein ACQESR_18665 [Planctomycetota bacterium]